MDNMISAWMELAPKKYGSISAGVKFINMITGSKLCSSNIYDMRIGKRNVPPSISRLIMNEILLTELENAKVETGGVDFGRLRDRLCVPERVEK